MNNMILHTVESTNCGLANFVSCVIIKMSKQLAKYLSEIGGNDKDADKKSKISWKPSVAATLTDV